MRLSNRILAYMTLLIPIGCATSPDAPAPAGQVTGVWVINHDQDAVDYSFIEYQAGGDKCEIQVSLGSRRRPDVTLYWNKWRFSDGVIYTTMHATNSIIPPGRQINDRVLMLNDHEMHALMIEPASDDAAREVHVRVPGATPGQVCGPVRRQLRSRRNR